jgi:hypothetical protein
VNAVTVGDTNYQAHKTALTYWANSNDYRRVFRIVKVGPFTVIRRYRPGMPLVYRWGRQVIAESFPKIVRGWPL